MPLTCSTNLNQTRFSNLVSEFIEITSNLSFSYNKFHIMPQFFFQSELLSLICDIDTFLLAISASLCLIKSLTIHS